MQFVSHCAEWATGVKVVRKCERVCVCLYRTERCNLTQLLNIVESQFEIELEFQQTLMTLCLIMAQTRYRQTYKSLISSTLPASLISPRPFPTSTASSILTRYTATHERCRLCAVDMRCLAEAAPDDHCGEFSSGQTAAAGTIEPLECPKYTQIMYWIGICSVFIFMFPHFRKYVRFCFWASARAKRPHRTTFSCELPQQQAKEPKNRNRKAQQKEKKNNNNKNNSIISTVQYVHKPQVGY